nr:hypothetical protein [Tanacetum cinerariifolium]GFA98739.1 hypothetical protein [Tanacetum cinerariifolium]
MRRVGKGFSGVDTPLFEGMIVAQKDDDIADEGAANVAADDVPAAADEPTILSPPPSQDLPFTSQDKIAQSLEIIKLRQRVKKLERRNKLKVSKLRRLKRVGTSQRVDTSKDTVMDDVSKQGRIIANMDADEDVTLNDVSNIAKEVALDTEIEESADVQGRQAESQAQIYQIDLEHADKDDMIDQVQRKEKEDNAVMRWTTSKEEEDSKALKRTSESQAKKAAKKQKLDEEICKATTARRIQIRVVFGYILQDQDKDQAG